MNIDDLQLQKIRNARERINKLLKNYQWQLKLKDRTYTNADSKEINWDDSTPFKYDTTNGNGLNTGSCIDQSKALKRKLKQLAMFYRVSLNSDNDCHVAAIANTDKGYTLVHAIPRNGNFVNPTPSPTLRELIKRVHNKSKNLNKTDYDYYILPDVPDTGTTKTLHEYAQQLEDPMKVRNNVFIH